jgi:hypothetical protein
VFVMSLKHVKLPACGCQVLSIVTYFIPLNGRAAPNAYFKNYAALGFQPAMPAFQPACLPPPPHSARLPPATPRLILPMLHATGRAAFQPGVYFSSLL